MENIGVVGAGAMGAGIAQVAAQSGHKVWVFDTRKEALDLASEKLAKTMSRLVEKGKFSETEAQALLDRISWVESLEELKDTDLVIEAIIENLEVKKQVFSKLESIVSSSCILASNTSSLSIAAISAAVASPERVIGIHFFNPAPLMPLVEIIPSIATSENTLKESKRLVDSWKKVTVIAKDTPGFIVNRVARPFYSEALKIYEEGDASLDTIDWAMTELGGFRMGPFTLMDLIGHDVNYVVTETVWTQFYYDPRFKPSITQKRLLEAGLNGRKSGRGFYAYQDGKYELKPTENKEIGQQIVNRILALLINEAADAVFMNIASAEDIDLAMTKGVNYPKGLLKWADEIGIQTVVNRLTELYEYYLDDRYRPCPLLREMAREKRTFY